MSSVSKRARSAKNPVVRPIPEYDVDPEAWHIAARTTLADLLAAAEDAVRPLGKRQLGRTEHKRIIVESGSSLYDTLRPPARRRPKMIGI